jgi:twinkle protein
MSGKQLVETHIACPKCPSSDAYCVYDDGHGYCFSCQYFKPGKEQFISNDEAYTYEYLPWRGVTKGTFEFFETKTKVDADGRPISIGFRYPNDAYKVRTLGAKAFSTVGEINKAGLFGRNRFEAGSHKCVTITEGELDACSLWQVLRSPCVSVHSSSSAVRDVSVDRDWVNSFDKVYLAFDNDAAGREAGRNVARLFDPNRVFLVKFNTRKDANEYLEHGEEQELRDIWWASKKYLPETIISSFTDFKKILEETPAKGISYPWPTLTEMTYGIRRGETVLFKAPEKVGKTALMHAIQHHILKETGDDINVGGIFLEEPKQRHLQSLAGIEIQRPAHLPDSGVSIADTVAALEKVLRRDDRLFVYSHFGSDDPDVLVDTIRFLVTACQCHYILFDHLTMAVSGLKGEADERRALDYICTRLEMMVKELHFALIMVSHVNDFGQTRGSRLPTKVADITVDVQRDMLSEDPIERNTVHLTIPFNRFCSKTGSAGNLYFNPVTYTYSELTGAQHV